MGYFSSSLYFSVLCKNSKISTFRFFALIIKVSGSLKRKTYTFFFLVTVILMLTKANTYLVVTMVPGTILGAFIY